MAAKHVLRYLQGKVDYGLKYTQMDGVKLEGYIDADCACSTTDKKSTFACCFSLETGVVSRFSRKQKSVSLSSC